MTEKLFEQTGAALDFEGRVLSCEPGGEGFAVVLDRTAFFPEGGGQGADTGTLGGVAVSHTSVRNGVVTHLCAGPLAVGTTVAGRVDGARRLDQTQQHSGEHIFSGLMHRRYGVDNVGFHIGAREVTIDFNGVFSWEQLLAVEREANALVFANVPVQAWYPERAALAAMNYRSKKEIDGPVRIVDIPGGDTCACCGTHVARTGEIGLIKLVSAMHYKGGMRLSIVCGGRALEDYERRRACTQDIGALLSSRAEETPVAVRRLKEERDALRRSADALCERVTALLQTALAPGDIALAAEDFTPAQAQRCARALSEHAPLAACVSRQDGGWRFVIASEQRDARAACRALCEAFGGRGGGKADMAQGTLTAFDEARAREILRHIGGMNP